MQGDEESTPLLHGEHEPCTATEPMETSSDEADASPSPLPPSASSDESYVMLNRQDAIEAMAYYIALHLSRVPEAQAMDPKQLQEALNGTFKVRAGSSEPFVSPYCAHASLRPRCMLQCGACLARNGTRRAHSGTAPCKPNLAP